MLIIKVGGLFGSGSPYITGWATTFFPYLSGETKSVQIWERNWQRVEKTFKTTDFNARMSLAPFEWNNNGVLFNMSFFAGLIGVNYNELDRSLMPIFGYGAYEK